MSRLAMLSIFARLQRSQWLDREGIRRLQERKLRRIVGHAYGCVPYYRELFDRAGVRPGDIRTLEDLTRIPVSTKKDFQSAGPAAVTSTAVAPGSLVSTSTSGSSGRPITLMCDRRWLSVRDGAFLRALWTMGYRPGRRLMLMSSQRGKRSPRWTRWRYFSFEQPPEPMLAEVIRFRPWMLYGWVTPLRQLAERVQRSGAEIPSLRVVVTTAEELDAVTRRLLREALGAEVYDIYGLTELGLVAWECAEHGHHVSEDTVIVEFLPGPDGRDESRLVMTKLELGATPFIRYDTGDLGVPAPDAPCACGRDLARLQRVGGRLVDCIRLSDGRVVSPYQLTLALERIPGIQRYQVIQDELNHFTVRFEGAPGALTRVDGAARRAIERIVGTDVRVSVRQESSLDPAPGGKFRVVRSQLAMRTSA